MRRLTGALGVVAIVSPWNFPIATASWKIAPALAFGNAVVWKPANITPASAWALTEIIGRQSLETSGHHIDTLPDSGTAQAGSGAAAGTSLLPDGASGAVTPALVSTLRLGFYWKHGLKMRPATGVTPGAHETRRLQPYASEFGTQLPEKLEWLFEFDVPSAGVPVTDSLVVVLSTPDGFIAARAAARM